MRFRTGGDQVTVLVRLDRARREELMGTAVAVLAVGADMDGWLRMGVTFEGSRHAEWALWQLGTDGEAPRPRRALTVGLRDVGSAVSRTALSSGVEGVRRQASRAGPLADISWSSLVSPNRTKPVKRMNTPFGLSRAVALLQIYEK